MRSRRESPPDAGLCGFRCLPATPGASKAGSLRPSVRALVTATETISRRGALIAESIRRLDAIRAVNDDGQRVLSDELFLNRPAEISMRIAQVAPLMEAVPPKLYGGSERIVAYLCDELTALGHDVTLFASGDSTVACKVSAVWPRALRLDTSISDYLAPHMILLEAVASQG